MNIFALDNDPRLAAQALCDVHASRMVLEYAQLLCNAFDEAPYRRTHYTVGVALWARHTDTNWRWLLELGLETAAEFRLRFGKEHASEAVIRWCRDHRLNAVLPSGPLTPFHQSTKEMPRLQDPVHAYRLFYVYDKLPFAHWQRGRPPPAWWPLGGQGPHIGVELVGSEQFTLTPRRR
jgi:hypothetical protein